jgi:hypothetical protein
MSPRFSAPRRATLCAWAGLLAALSGCASLPGGAPHLVEKWLPLEGPKYERLFKVDGHNCQEGPGFCVVGPPIVLRVPPVIPRDGGNPDLLIALNRVPPERRSQPMTLACRTSPLAGPDGKVLQVSADCVLVYPLPPGDAR